MKVWTFIFMMGAIFVALHRHDVKLMGITIFVVSMLLVCRWAMRNF